MVCLKDFLKQNYFLTANLMSPSCIVFLPACFAMSFAFLEMLRAISVSFSVNSETASSETLFAPALIRILATDALGIVVPFLPIKPHLVKILREKTKKNHLVFVLPLLLCKLFK